MTRLFVRKGLLVLVLVPLIHAAGFWYATRFGPQHVLNQYGFMVERDARLSFSTTYPLYIAQLLRGDWGTVQNVPILAFIAGALPCSAALLAIAMGVTAMLGPLLGVAAIGRRTGRVTPFAQMVLTIGSSVPGFSWAVC